MKDTHITQYIDKEDIIIEARKALKVVHISIKYDSFPKGFHWLGKLFKRWLDVSVLVTTFHSSSPNFAAVVKAAFLSPGDTICIDHEFKIKFDGSKDVSDD